MFPEGREEGGASHGAVRGCLDISSKPRSHHHASKGAEQSLDTRLFSRSS